MKMLSMYKCEVRIYDSATENESVFVGCEIKSNCDGRVAGFQ